MNLLQYLDEHTRRINLDHHTRDGVYYHQCRTCKAEWPAELPTGPANPNWWRCPNGCNTSAGDLKSPKIRVRRNRS